MKVTNHITRLVVILITIGLCFLLLETGLRAVGRIPSNMTDGFFEKSGESYRLKKNFTKIVNWPSYSYTAITNAYGFRDSRNGERDINSKPCIVFLGGSDAFGNGVNYEHSFVGIFAEAASKRDIEILNMAVGGHYFVDQKIILLESMNKLPRKPSTLILCINPTVMSSFDRDHKDIIVKGGYLFRKDSWKLGYLRLRIGNLSSAYCFFRDNVRKLSTKWVNSDSKASDSFLKIFQKSNRIFDPEVTLQFENKLDEFRTYCQENSITFVLLYLPLIDRFRLNELLLKLGKDPEEYDASYYEELAKAYCRKRDLKLINVEPILRSHYDKGMELRFALDAHYNKYANRVVGSYLIEEMFSDKE